MSKFTDYIGKQFGNPQGIWGKLCCVIMNLINKKMYVRTVSLVQGNDGDKILDIGYGNGYLLKRLDSTGKKYDLYGIDISNDMKNVAEKRNARALAENRLHLQVGDCCAMSFEDELFSAVTSINTIYFWNDAINGLSEIRRTLKSGGKFYNVVYTKEWLDKLSYTKNGFKKYSPDALMEMGKEAGFSEVVVQDIVAGKSFVVIYTK